MMKTKLRGLYAITPEWTDTERLLRVSAAILPYTAILQYRHKSQDALLRQQQALALVQLCRQHGVPFVVNDDVELAHQVQADGVHLGRDDTALAAARLRLGPQAIIGATCYQQLSLATQAIQAGADYVAFGAMYASSSKPHAPLATPSLLHQAQCLNVPIVAIGGITPHNAPHLIAQGADAVAVIASIFDSPDPAKNAQQLASLF